MYPYKVMIRNVADRGDWLWEEVGETRLYCVGKGARPVAALFYSDVLVEPHVGVKSEEVLLPEGWQ
jgi:hypothetical protein